MTHAGDAISFAELDRRANRLASVLRASGAGPESRVGVALPRTIDLVVGFLAVLKAGGTYVPIDPGYPLQRRDFMLADADVAVLLTDTELAGARAGPGYPVVVTGDPASAVRPPVPAPATGPVHAEAAAYLVRAENAAYVIYTSGSTGVPKGVVVEHRHVVGLVLCEPRLAVAPGDLVAQLAPTSFDASTFEIWAALCRGGTVTILPGPQLSVKELGGQLRHHRPDWLFLTTGLFHLLADFDPDVLAALGTLITGGDILSPEHIRTAAGVGSTRVYAAYGPTETTVFASLHDADATVGRDRVPIGSPLPGTAMYVLDGNLNQVPDGELGEIYIGGERVARGYHRRPGITAARFLPDPFHSAQGGARMYRTGDLGRVLPDGELEFHGRVDRQVKIRGFRVELGELEAVLAAHPDVSGAVARAVAVGDGEKRLAVYVTGRSGATLAVSELKAWAERRLPGYALPARYVVLSSLPLDANGKFDRRALPDPWASRAAIRGLAAYVAPRTELERAIAAAWTDSLELDVVGVHDNFFELGGDSLRSVSVLERLRTHGFDLTAGDFFGHATVAELAGLIHRLRGSSESPEGGAPQPPVPVGSLSGTEG